MHVVVIVHQLIDKYWSKGLPVSSKVDFVVRWTMHFPVRVVVCVLIDGMLFQGKHSTNIIRLSMVDGMTW